MIELVIDPDGVDCPKTGSKRSARDCWIPGGLQCDHLEGLEGLNCRPVKTGQTKPRIVVRCIYPEV